MTIAAHYEQVADQFDTMWSYSSAEFVDWMATCLVRALCLRGTDRVADVGCGTGLYARRLAEHAAQVVCLDPSPAMLDRLPDDPRLVAVEGTAEQASDLIDGAFDAILLKEALHHVPRQSRAGVIDSLASRLVHGGRLVIAMPPATLDLPLFQAALDRYAGGSMTPEVVADAMAQAGLTVSAATESFDVQLPTQVWIDMVRNRYMSLLGKFTDAELAAGITEIRTAHPEPAVSFTERFVFLQGVTSR